jgi:hypothetical protein
MATKAKKTAKATPAKKNGEVNEDGFPILGWLVNWSSRNLSIPRADLIKALNAARIPGEIAREVLPKNAAIRAVREAAKGKDTFHRKVADQEDRTSLVIAETEVDGNLDPKFSMATKTIFDKSSRSIKVEGKQKDHIEQLFEQKKQVYSSDQFRSIILRYVKSYCSGITYLETGNIYFVPVFRKQELEKLQMLFKSIGSGAYLVCKEEINTKKVRSVMWDITVNEVEHKVRKMREDLEELPPEAKEQSLELRLRKYDELKTKVEMFESVLQGKADKLKSELGKLTKAVKERVIED